jgi:hypothetical protein
MKCCEFHSGIHDEWWFHSHIYIYIGKSGFQAWNLGIFHGEISQQYWDLIGYPPTPADSRGNASEKRGHDTRGKNKRIRTRMAYDKNKTVSGKSQKARSQGASTRSPLTEQRRESPPTLGTSQSSCHSVSEESASDAMRCRETFLSDRVFFACGTCDSFSAIRKQR